MQPGQPVVVADYIGWTSHQPDTFFSDAHTGLEINYGSVRSPLCPEMGAAIQQLLPGLPEAVTVGVDFLRRETRAEARMFRSWGADVLTYNLAPEVALAQEMGLCYAGLVTVSGYAADRAQPEPMGEVRASLSTTLQMLPAFIEMVAQERQCACGEEGRGELRGAGGEGSLRTLTVREGQGVRGEGTLRTPTVREGRDWLAGYRNCRFACSIILDNEIRNPQHVTRN